MELVGIFLLLAPLGALILYLRRNAATTARETAFSEIAEGAPVIAEPPPAAEPEVAESVVAVEVDVQDEPRRMQL